MNKLYYRGTWKYKSASIAFNLIPLPSTLPISMIGKSQIFPYRACSTTPTNDSPGSSVRVRCHNIVQIVLCMIAIGIPRHP